MNNKIPKKSKAAVATTKVKNFIQGGVTGYAASKGISSMRPANKKKKK